MRDLLRAKSFAIHVSEAYPGLLDYSTAAENVVAIAPPLRQFNHCRPPLRKPRSPSPHAILTPTLPN
ncbi:hypothetical protein TIFTF001_039896 [Ficus carica]|uniref:Uncharacterized protein n=1 Tax=Ficus carica TaxID=3494 RepID=A0AA87YVM7_FICCA|nr:hypothetical protein TIFTF001_039891 [Ficus carica]GMN19790.1 hypothetical protein TIFTF001_039896 [Ficus carica]